VIELERSGCDEGLKSRGLCFGGEGNAPGNPQHTYTANVFDPSIHGKSDQLAFRFKERV
jgi:predicted methyltransferase